MDINKKKYVISFSLWGNSKKYTIGAIKCANQALKCYPNFECWFYIHKETVPNEIIIELSKLSNVKIIFKSGNLNIVKPMMWRFETIDDPNVEVNLSRDTDTRFRLREILAVNEWLKSNKTFHIMRDHPHHYYFILGGMFGTKKIKKIPSWIELMNNIEQVGPRSYDQYFLGKYIYPIVMENDDVIIHASFNKKEGKKCLDYPIPFLKELNFVGEYVFSDETKSIGHTNILKNSILTNNINYLSDISENDYISIHKLYIDLHV